MAITGHTIADVACMPYFLPKAKLLFCSAHFKGCALCLVCDGCAVAGNANIFRVAYFALIVGTIYCVTDYLKAGMG